MESDRNAMSQLPAEVVEIILSYLSPKEVLSVSETERLLNSIIKDDNFWRNHMLKGHLKLSNEEIEKLKKQFPGKTYLDIFKFLYVKQKIFFCLPMPPHYSSVERVLTENLIQSPSADIFWSNHKEDVIEHMKRIEKSRPKVSSFMGGMIQGEYLIGQMEVPTSFLAQIKSTPQNLTVPDGLLSVSHVIFASNASPGNLDYKIENGQVIKSSRPNLEP